jgi:hypothetical protein
MCFILIEYKCYGTLPQVLEIIFEVQRKLSNEKNNKNINELSNLQHTFFFFSFFSLWTPPTFKPYNLLISYSF